jgi:hypothetical protein
VAQTVINRMRHPGYPKSVCGVIYEGAARGTGCQFSFTCDGSLERTSAPALWTNAEIVAKRALAGFVMKDVGAATHYHANYVYPYWAPTLVKLNTVGTHIFYRWTGPSGRQAAFKGRYSGNETLSAEILMGADPRTLEAAPPGSLAAIAAGGEGFVPVATGEPAKIVSPEGVVEILPPMTVTRPRSSRLVVADRVVGLLVVFLGQEAHGLQGGHAAHAGRGDRLAIDVVGDVAGGVDAGHRGRGARLDLQIARGRQLPAGP